MIEVEDLTKNYGTLEALKGVSFRIDKGEVVGFLGPNGAGKTTTMRILTCFMPATSGRATVAGYDILQRIAWGTSGILATFPKMYRSTRR